MKVDCIIHRKFAISDETVTGLKGIIESRVDEEKKRKKRILIARRR